MFPASQAAGVRRIPMHSISTDRGDRQKAVITILPLGKIQGQYLFSDSSAAALASQADRRFARLLTIMLFCGILIVISQGLE